MYEILLYVTLAAGMLPCIIFYLKETKAKEGASVVLPLLLLTAFASIYETLGSLVLQWDTSYWFRVYDLLEFCAIFYFFFRLMGLQWRKWLYLFPFAYVIVYMGGLLLWQQFNELQVKALFSTILIGFICTAAFIWLNIRFKNIKEVLAISPAVLMFLAAILLYYTSTYFLFLVSNELFTSAKEDFENYWSLNVVATLLYRILLIIGVCLIK